MNKFTFKPFAFLFSAAMCLGISACGDDNKDNDEPVDPTAIKAIEMEYTTDITPKIYVRYRTTDIRRILRFEKICEQYTGEESNYVIGTIRLSELLEKRDRVRAPDLFLANLPIFFLDRDR